MLDLKKDYNERVVPALMKSRKYENIHQVPKLTKIVLNHSCGSSNDTKQALDDAIKELNTITGQKPIRTLAKKSVSNFKLRQGMEIGAKVTLRGRMMYEFLLRLTAAALPRIRDFRGISNKAFDKQGNYTLGIKDHTIFPEIELDKVKRTIGMDICFVTTAKDKEESKELLLLMGMPFAGSAEAKKSEEQKEEAGK